jgi:hypothetical protein
MSLSERHAPAVRAFTFQRVWSQQLGSGARGLALARERGSVLVWDQNNWLHLLNEAGQRQGQIHLPDEVVAACCADDGSAYAAVAGHGLIRWLAPDLTVRWQHSLPHPALAAAMDPFGQYLAVADNRGTVHILDRLGRTCGQVHTPRPLHHLDFVPAVPMLVGCADYGLALCFDLAGTVHWRDGLVAHAGGLAVSGDGARILIACFSEGLQGYDLAGQNLGRLQISESCRLVSLAFTARFILVAGLSNALLLLDAEGKTLGTYHVDEPVAALALSALGDYAVIAATDGTVLHLQLSAA